ncbi:MAG TPA: protealysin inhibitor emfourin [Chthonomonadaceae bacterium]|nr:protealysin inhibitor emfourin [Chthonomonadaceae bacterium]
MRIQHSVSGGLAYFPGLSRPRTLDTDTLPPEVANDLIESVSASNFFALPDQVGTAPAGAADLQQHTLTVEDNERSHTVRILETVRDPALQALLQKVETQLRKARAS